MENNEVYSLIKSSNPDCYPGQLTQVFHAIDRYGVKTKSDLIKFVDKKGGKEYLTVRNLGEGGMELLKNAVLQLNN